VNSDGFVPRHLPPALVWFSGDRGEFRKLVKRGAGSNSSPIGFYRFWLGDRHAPSFVVEHSHRRRCGGVQPAVPENC